mmetsp:Transcript_9067/g.22510  ORF Transcript_9067/g.22510 Transcript_9067/m.22510 type:complete len:369 (+) Transcript_9067:802-1908(+)
MCHLAAVDLEEAIAQLQRATQRAEPSRPQLGDVQRHVERAATHEHEAQLLVGRGLDQRCGRDAHIRLGHPLRARDERGPLHLRILIVVVHAAAIRPAADTRTRRRTAPVAIAAASAMARLSDDSRLSLDSRPGWRRRRGRRAEECVRHVRHGRRRGRRAGRSAAPRALPAAEARAPVRRERRLGVHARRLGGEQQRRAGLEPEQSRRLLEGPRDGITEPLRAILLGDARLSRSDHAAGPQLEARLVPRDALGALGTGGEEAAEEIEAARVTHEGVGNVQLDELVTQQRGQEAGVGVLAHRLESMARARVEDGEGHLGGHVLAPGGGDLLVLEGKALPGVRRPVFSPPPLPGGKAPPQEVADALRLVPG